ncbi:holo-ACP synthase [Ligilactobacillus hohenheimensis]|uniref:holo-ACP synthase n=1 Tax=Ligilactobacillus hohenheimensis TaxID=2991832 RepID=UPI0024B9632D|nr:holo-ACP synthase [Ligilactobacillus hohenheimensis]
MIYGIGIDVAPLARIKRAAAKQHFIDYVLTPREREQYDALPSPKRQVEYLAGRFSAKESYSKALGTGIGKSVGFHDLTVLNDKAGKPYFAAHPRKGVLTAHVSITHTDELAGTEVILEQNGGEDE